MSLLGLAGKGAGTVLEWKIRKQKEGGETMNVESMRRSAEYLERRFFEKEEKAEEDRKFRHALLVITVTGGILTWIAWRILF